MTYTRLQFVQKELFSFALLFPSASVSVFPLLFAIVKLECLRLIDPRSVMDVELSSQLKFNIISFSDQAVAWQVCLLFLLSTLSWYFISCVYLLIFLIETFHSLGWFPCRLLTLPQPPSLSNSSPLAAVFLLSPSILIAINGSRTHITSIFRTRSNLSHQSYISGTNMLNALRWSILDAEVKGVYFLSDGDPSDDPTVCLHSFISPSDDIWRIREMLFHFSMICL